MPLLETSRHTHTAGSSQPSKTGERGKRRVPLRFVSVPFNGKPKQLLTQVGTQSSLAPEASPASCRVQGRCLWASECSIHRPKLWKQGLAEGRGEYMVPRSTDFQSQPGRTVTPLGCIKEQCSCLVWFLKTRAS